MNSQQIKGLSRMLLLACFILIPFIKSFSQSNYLLDKSYENLQWSDFVMKLEKDFQIRFFYEDSILENFRINVPTSSCTLNEVLSQILNAKDIKFSIDQSGNVFLSKKVQLKTSLPTDFFKAHREKVTDKSLFQSDSIKAAQYLKTVTEYVAKKVVIGTKQKGLHQTEASVSGFAKNSSTGEVIVGATIMDDKTKTGIATDNNGFFEMTLSKGIHKLIVNSVNIKEQIVEVEVLSDGSLNLFLEDKIIQLEDVIITAKQDDKVKTTEMGIERLNIESIKKIPLVFGEQDVIKVALLLPGVQTVGEGTSGFNIRGGSTDQNLFYINKVPVYNTSHVAGFFSAFNSDAIDKFSLYKSSIPVNYGGRLASVFDIKSKKGDSNKFKANGGIGIITQRLMVEGPIQKSKSSFVVGIRSTYSDWVLKLLDNEELQNSKVKFGDVLLNLDFQINSRDQLNIFTYLSSDNIKLAKRTKYDYQNVGASVSWKHYFENNSNFELSLAHSNYTFNEENTEITSIAYKDGNQIKHTEATANYNIQATENNHLLLGFNSTLYQLDRGNPQPLSSESQFSPLELGKEKGLESGLFISDEWTVSPKLTLNAGLRFNLYTYLGPQTLYSYQENLPKTTINIQDTLSFGNNEPIKTYSGLDYRVSANYMLNDELSIKMAYNRMHQYIYMLSNTIALAPNNKWKLVDYNTKPLMGDQISAGLFANLMGRQYELSIEGYYKQIQNVVEIKNGASIFLEKNAERSTLQGKAEAYGIEFMIKKLFGKTTGWLNYTYSNSTVTVNSAFPENQINFGEPYPSNYDKPHAFNFVLNHNFSRRFNISTNIVYSTGRPITYPTSVVSQNNTLYLNYSYRNEYRLPDYFRVDLSLSLEGNLIKRKLAHGSWSVSVYNLLGRKNAYSVYFKEDDGVLKGYKISIFGAPIFSLTYNIKLGNYAN